MTVKQLVKLMPSKRQCTVQGLKNAVVFAKMQTARAVTRRLQARP